MDKTYIHAHSVREDGTKFGYVTFEVPAKTKLLAWQKAGLSYTASGYGNKVPTTIMVQWEGRWHRVYCRIYSNSGTCYIVVGGLEYTVSQ